MTKAEFEALVIRHLRAIGAAYQVMSPKSPHQICAAVFIDGEDASVRAFNAHWRCDNDFPVDIVAPTFGREDKREEPCQPPLTEPNEEPCKSSPVLYQKPQRLATPRTERLAQNIKALREARGLTTLDLACDLKTTVNSVRLWESGDRVPVLKTLCILSDYFGYTMDDLVYNNLEGENTK